MGSYKRVLVGTDGSESSFRAVDKAAQVAKDTGAKLLLACAYAPAQRKDAAAQRELGEDAYAVSASHTADEVLGDAAARVRNIGVTNVETASIEGDPVDALARLAADWDVDLVVVGNRGLNSLAGRLLGSVPANITHRAPCDVLIVHTTSGGRR